VTTEDKDPDGDLFSELRKIVGTHVPVVATVDLHANISTTTFDAVDLIIPYYTNPHVDQYQRGAEAARFLHLMMRPGDDRLVLTKNFLRLPLIVPSVCLLTTDAGPFARWVAHAHQEKGIDVPVVGLIPGFAWSDTQKNGFLILTYGDAKVDTTKRAKNLAETLAKKIWSERYQTSVKLTSLETAVQLAQQAQLDVSEPICLADVADNPGGGGSSRVTDILRALLNAQAQHVLMGNFHLPELARICHELGPGASFTFEFDSDTDEPLSKEVQVLGLSEGSFVGRRGLIAGRTVNLGLSAAVKFEGITLVVTSRKAQACDPCYFEAFGLRISDYKIVVLKSRGHFRAGFDEFFENGRIFEVDSNGLTSPRLDRFEFNFLPRPSFPLDADTQWTLDCTYKG
jgi:microcystin degradation protein MlrC